MSVSVSKYLDEVIIFFSLSCKWLIVIFAFWRPRRSWLISFLNSVTNLSLAVSPVPVPGLLGLPGGGLGIPHRWLTPCVMTWLSGTETTVTQSMQPRLGRNSSLLKLPLDSLSPDDEVETKNIRDLFFNYIGDWQMSWKHGIPRFLVTKIICM